MVGHKDVKLPFSLRITDQHTANKLARAWPTHTVSLLDPDCDTTLVTPDGRWCRCFFHDSTPRDRLSRTLASLEDIQRILAFTAELGAADRLLVHCYAGISRSTAVALGILCQHGLSPRQAMTVVRRLRPIASPNAHILALFDAVLALDEALSLLTSCRGTVD